MTRRLLVALVVIPLLSACASAQQATRAEPASQASPPSQPTETSSSPARGGPSTRSGLSSPIGKPAPPVTLRVGQTVTVSDRTFKTSGTVRVTLEKISYVHEADLPPHAVFCLMLVTVRNIGKISSTGPFLTYPVWIGADGRQNDEVQFDGIGDPVAQAKHHFITGILSPGQSQHGFALFVVPDDEPGKIVFSEPSKLIIPIDPTHST